MSAPTGNNIVSQAEATPPSEKMSDVNELVPSAQEVKVQNAELKSKPILKEEGTIASKSNEEPKNEIKHTETESVEKPSAETVTKQSEVPENKIRDNVPAENSREVVKSEQKPSEESVLPITSTEAVCNVSKIKEATSEVKVLDEIKLLVEKKDDAGNTKSAPTKVEQLANVSSLEETKTTETVNASSPEGSTELNTGAPTSQVEITKEQPNINKDTNQKEKSIEEKPVEGKPETSDPSQISLPQTETKQESQSPNGGTTGGAPENNEDEAPQEECIDIQELSEQVMNIINEGIATDNANRDDLLKRNTDLQQFIVKLIHLLKEKTDLSINLERQNSALISQAKSLKDVISITKDLLGIRNMEVEHLQADLDSMQEAIKAERNRHNTALQHLTEAMGLNDKLKAEYLTQMDLFEKLKEKYTEKVVILTRENIRLTTLMQQNGLDSSAAVNEPPEPVQADPDPNQPESVDK